MAARARPAAAAAAQTCSVYSVLVKKASRPIPSSLESESAIEASPAEIC